MLQKSTTISHILNMLFSDSCLFQIRITFRYILLSTKSFKDTAKTFISRLAQRQLHY